MTAIRLAALLLTLAALMVPPGNCGGAERVLRLSDGRVIGFARMIEELKGARLIFVGENHDQPEHHQAQLEIIKALRRAGVPLAIGMEMFTSGSQGELDRWVVGRLSLDEMVRLYYREWRMPWPLYRDILLYARDQRIPLIALNVPRSISRKVSRQGFAALTQEERKQLPSGVTCSVDPAYREFIRRAYAEHGRNENSFVHFCEAQMLWNKSMARHLQQYLALSSRATVVVLAGAGHAMKGGIPEELSRDSGYRYRVILPEFPGLDRRTVTGRDADYLLLDDRGE
ncbi:MAG: ChaN family lipoprotein [Geobacteraceae bacterium]|nr:ChaN family lipoprotein [Geobacteraceae bacterium]